MIKYLILACMAAFPVFEMPRVNIQSDLEYQNRYMAYLMPMAWKYYFQKEFDPVSKPKGFMRRN